MKHTETRSGSALVVVLGMLAVIMLMAVAFSVYMRTERAGTTNLRHALVAKQMMQSAIARTMQAIDASFGEEDAGGNWVADPKANWAAPNWEEPYLTSHEPTSADPAIFLSRPATDAERANNARVLTREIMMHLTPAQLALADNARIDWARINSGVGAEWDKDPIMGRYAFIAFDVSGLHDMNKAGADVKANIAKTYKARATDFATNAVNYQVEESIFFGSHGGSAFKPDYETFVTARGDRPFMSMADFWRRIGIVNGPEDYRFELDKPIDPDLFTTYSMSLEGLAPDGSMKLPLVALESEAQKKTYAKLAIESFKKMFAEAKDDKEFKFRYLPKFTRSQLATQGLVDYLDDDDVPSGGIDNGRDASDGHLDFPCTEPVPLVTQAMAYFEVGAPTTVTDPNDPTKSYQEYEVKFHALCEAQFLNDKVPANLATKNYQLKAEMEFIDLYDLLPQLWGPGWETGANGWFVSFPNPTYLPNVQTLTSGAKKLMSGNRAQRNLVAKTPDTGVPVLKVRAYNKAVGGFRKFSMPEEQAAAQSIRTEIRIKAQVLSGSTVVQQVPAPTLEKIRAQNGFRIKVAPGLYRNPVEAAKAVEKLEYGWALCLDPRFAYNTETMGTTMEFTGAAGYRFWVDNALAHDDLPSGGDPVMTQVAQMLVDAELVGGIEIQELGNLLTRDIVFAEPDPTAARNIADMWANGLKVYPDSYHLFRKNGKTFLETDKVDYTTLLFSRIANLPMVSPGELGNLIAGPWETLSLYGSFDPNGAVVFHRALDYFCMGQARYPTMAELAGKTLVQLNKERHLSALQSGRINLNPQRRVKSSRNYERRGEQMLDADGYPEYNIDPLVCVFNGAAINQDAAPTQLDVDAAEDIARAFYDQAKAFEKNGPDRGALMISRLSDLGQCNVASNANPVLEILMDYAGVGDLNITCDAHREALVANSVNALTTRGQSFLVVIRAEAYAPRYGSDSPDNGTTLSTTYAVVELWRDPEPARFSAGALHPDNDTPSHAWVIRSIRWF